MEDPSRQMKDAPSSEDGEDWLEAGREQAVEISEPSGRNHVEEDIKPDDIHRWAGELRVTSEQLRVAIQRVGPNSAKVRAFLGI